VVDLDCILLTFYISVGLAFLGLEEVQMLSSYLGDGIRHGKFWVSNLQLILTSLCIFLAVVALWSQSQLTCKFWSSTHVQWKSPWVQPEGARNCWAKLDGWMILFAVEWVLVLGVLACRDKLGQGLRNLFVLEIGEQVYCIVCSWQLDCTIYSQLLMLLGDKAFNAPCLSIVVYCEHLQ
jgi:hypothetical protein